MSNDQVGEKTVSRDGRAVRDVRQSRSLRTREALLDAAERLFAKDGVEATSVAEIAKRAKCSVGAVYHHFKDKESLLYALYARTTERWRSVGQDILDAKRWEGQGIADILDAMMRYVLLTAREYPGHKQAALEALRMDPSLRDDYYALEVDLSKAMFDLLWVRRAEIDHPDPERALRFVLDQINAMLKLRTDIACPHALLAACSDEAFIEEALISVRRHLGFKSSP